MPQIAITVTLLSALWTYDIIRDKSMDLVICQFLKVPSQYSEWFVCSMDTIKSLINYKVHRK